jgi:predicted phage terminase large subunit-like protein
MKWNVIYERAYRQDGSLFFPQKLSAAFLEGAKRIMGSYMFSNQYLNDIIPSDMQTFKKEWFQYYSAMPVKYNTFISIDPALSEADTSDYTGVVVVHVDQNNQWYVPYAKRHKVTPTQLIDLVFKLHAHFKPNTIGIEEVAYQKALLYFLDEEMRRRNLVLPVQGIKHPNTKSKQTRILSLVPRFEWGHISLTQGLNDLELELLKFPRATHDDLIDALASIEYIFYPPDNKEIPLEKPRTQGDPRYEKWYIDQLQRGRNPREHSSGESDY